MLPVPPDLAATGFYDRYDDATERLAAIMQNVVTNGGTFIP